MFYVHFYKKLIKENKALKKPLILLSILNLLLSSTAILFAFFSKYTLDAVLTSDNSTFYQGTIILLIIIIFQFLVKVSYQYYSITQQTLLHKHLQSKYFKSLISSKLSIINNKHRGVWMNMLDSDVSRLSSGLLEILPRFIFMLSRFILAFILLFILDKYIAIIISILGISLVLVGTLLRHEMKKRHHKRQDAEGKVRSFIQEQLSHTPLIKSFNAENYTLENLSKVQEEYAKAKVHQTRLTIVFGTGLQALFMIIYAAALSIGAYRISISILSIGSLVAILQLVEYMQSPFRLANSILPAFAAMEASHERLQYISSLPQEATINTKITDISSIVASDLSFGYDGKSNIISNLNFIVNKGEIVQIKGDSGIGKTTMLYLLLALLEPSSGKLEINAEKLVAINSTSRNLFAYVPQQLNLMSGTIKENILYSRKNISNEKLVEVCKSCQIHNDIMNLDDNYNSIIGENGIGLSEGQLQRLAIARALIGNEPILLLDEISSALDSKAEKTVFKTLKNIDNKIIFIVSHKELPIDFINKTINI